MRLSGALRSWALIQQAATENKTINCSQFGGRFGIAILRLLYHRIKEVCLFGNTKNHIFLVWLKEDTNARLVSLNKSL